VALKHIDNISRIFNSSMPGVLNDLLIITNHLNFVNIITSIIEN
jgi:hypothetical protein